MYIEIRKLTPDLAEDYAHFFDVTPHSDHPDDDELKCYCVWYCHDDQDKTFVNRFLSSPELRREYACLKKAALSYMLKQKIDLL